MCKDHNALSISWIEWPFKNKNIRIFSLEISDNLVLMGLLNFSLRKSPFFQATPNSTLLLVKAICLANIAKFFLLPIVIWKTQQSNFMVQLNFLLVIGYFICGLIHVHSGTSRFFFLWNIQFVASGGQKIGNFPNFRGQKIAF